MSWIAKGMIHCACCSTGIVRFVALDETLTSVSRHPMAGFRFVDDSLVNPEAHHASTLRCDLKDADEPATDRRRRSLGDVDGYDQGSAADTKASDGASGVNHVQIAHGSSHESATKQKHEGAKDNGPATADALSKREGKESTCGTSRLEGRDNVCLDSVTSVRSQLAHLEVADERIKRHCTPNDRGVVAHCEVMKDMISIK